jgi:hypothetical protein
MIKNKSILPHVGSTVSGPTVCLSCSMNQSLWYIGLSSMDSILQCLKWPWYKCSFWLCVSFVQCFTKGEGNCQDPAEIALTWPLEGNSMLSSTSLLFIIPLPRRETGTTVYDVAPWLNDWPGFVTSECAHDLLRYLSRCKDQLSVEQQAWWWLKCL